MRINKRMMLLLPLVCTPTLLGATEVDHRFAFEHDAKANQITVTSKTYQGQSDKAFVDGYGREVAFRGYNVSGKVKHREFNFKPFKHAEDAQKSFNALRATTGANVVRFTIAWEGVHTAPDEIDYTYLDEVIAQMREAIKLDMYILVDYHSDLYSRHTFGPNNDHTGNGAPDWIVKGGDHEVDATCLSCSLSWALHKLHDEGVRSAIRSFWLNDSINTAKGTRYVQDEFLWQLGKVASYLKQQLSQAEFSAILGIEPLNEPFDGGITELGLASNDYAAFDNQLLWPFYYKARKALTNNGWNNKYVFAEPMVFWSTNDGFSDTGGHYLTSKPGSGFVFTPHFYDQKRMFPELGRTAHNAAYFDEMFAIRDEARFLDLPLFLSEFGMWLGEAGQHDNARIINATYQGMEISDKQHGKDRYTDFYTPLISGTQWQWDYYYNHHHEYVNGNPNNLVTEKDAWNGENFSVIRDYAQGLNVDPATIDRVYPRRVQGDLLHFHYNAMAADAWDKKLNWVSLRVDRHGVYDNKEYFRDKKFALLTWQGRHAEAPTEIFLPKGMNHQAILVITDKAIVENIDIRPAIAANNPNEVLRVQDIAGNTNSGSRLYIWDDIDSDETDDTIHYALVVAEPNRLNPDELHALQCDLTYTLQHKKQSALYMTGQMTESGYEVDHADPNYFTLVNQGTGMCLDLAGGRTFRGTNVQSYPCNGSEAQLWKYNAATGQIISRRSSNRCLDFAGDYEDGANLKIWSCLSSGHRNIGNQQFDMADGKIWLKANHRFVVHAQGNTESSNVGIATNSSSNQQRWKASY